jgi:hypothetical protein
MPLAFSSFSGSRSFGNTKRIFLISSTYSVTPAAGSVNEGSPITFNVTTTNVPNGTTLYWTINLSGSVTSGDFNATSGNFVINSNAGNFIVTPTADVTTEGAETFTVSIRTDSTSGTIVVTSSSTTINDTSIQATQRGWFFGGFVGASSVSSTERITFSNDTQIAVNRGNLVKQRYYHTVTSSSTNSYIIGGIAIPSPAADSSIERFSFSNDTATATLLSSIIGSSVAGRDRSTAVEDSTYSWMAGGFPGPRSVIHRLTFSSDSTNTTVRSNLSAARYGLTGVDNDTFGWWGGGLPATSLIDRTTFSTDTTNAISRGRLSATRSYFASSENSTYGWFLGGGPSPIKSLVDRLTFSSDTTTNSVRGPLVNSVRFSSATGDSNYGWNAGGESPNVSTVSRIDYANDTSTSSSRGPLTASKTSMGDHGTTAVA